MDEAEDRQEQERLASAGEPEAIRAIASMQSSTPLEPPLRISKRKAETEEPTPEPGTSTGKERKDAADAQAFKLMDAAFRKWKRGAEKDIRKANRELARDLLGDGAIYLAAGILKLSELLDSTVKLTALAKPKEEDADGENFDDEMEDWRKVIRGIK